MEDQFPILKHFAFSHLPPHLQAVSKPFSDLANSVAGACGPSRAAGAETGAALRKLLEAKDCAVRAALEA